ncbi:hypothetical protein NG791_24055 [Laspinema sp. D1]|uniref:hypothetical protein n=1 Tax=Laspinema palackyanum TaxID=3231601 RepID=UPI003479234C|nr:hypothetical protein [Laspinema sp. D2b]
MGFFFSDLLVTQKQVSPASIQALKPERLLRDESDRFRPAEPHPNPPLGKGREPEVPLITRQITISGKNLPL